MAAEYEFTFTDQPMNNAEFMQYLEFIASFSPTKMNKDQLRMLMALLLRNYATEIEDSDELDDLALSAVDTALQYEEKRLLDMSVGPEDGVH